MLYIYIIKMTLKPVYSSSVMYTHICINNLKILYLVDEYISKENYPFTLIFTSYKLKISVIIIKMSFLNIELCYRKFKKTKLESNMHVFVIQRTMLE